MNKSLILFLIIWQWLIFLCHPVYIYRDRQVTKEFQLQIKVSLFFTVQSPYRLFFLVCFIVNYKKKLVPTVDTDCNEMKITITTSQNIFTQKLS